MLRVTLKGLLARKVRLMLSAVAVVLGVAMVSGTYVLTDTISSAFDNLFSAVNRNTAVAVRGATGAGFDNNDSNAARPALPESLVARIEAVPGVREVAPSVRGAATIFDPANGKAVANLQAPNLGLNYTGGDLGGLTLRTGTAPQGPDQVAVDRQTFNKIRLTLGEQVEIQAGTKKARMYTVVGVITVGSSDSLAGATIAAFDLPTAQSQLLSPGRVSQIDVASDGGVNQTELASRIRQVVGAGVDVVTGEQLNEQTSQGIKNGIGFFTLILSVFGYIALVVGLFIIANTFAMLIGQRARELALLRAVGASRAQVIRSVLAEGLAVGVVGSVIGLGAGIGLAIGARSLMSSLGIDLPAAGLVVATRTIILALVLGIVVTTLAALLPAVRASRVPPVAAMQETFVLPSRSLRTRGLLGVVLLVAGLAVLIKGTTGTGGSAAQVVGLGALVILIGVVTLAPLIAGPVVSLLGSPFRRLFGTVGVLASENARRSPRRTAATASALMIGLALITAVSVLASSIKTSVGNLVSRGTGATFILLGSGSQSLPADLSSSLNGKPGVANASGIALVPLRIGTTEALAAATDPAALTDNILLTASAGDLGSLSPTTILISKKTADEKRWKVGTELPVGFAEGGRTTLRVSGIYQENQLAGSYLIDKATAVRYVTNLTDVVGLVRATDGSDPNEVLATIDEVLAEYPGVKVQTRGEYIQNAQDQIGQLVNLIYGLLLLSVVIAFFGIVNTLALSVIERTREIGLLRAVGMSRRQLRSMIWLESLVIALYGALLGVALGSLFGWAILPPLADQGLDSFSYPGWLVVLFFFVAGLLGVVAALLPARRAARLDVLRAIATT